MNKKLVFLVLFCFIGFSLSAKLTFSDKKGGAGHADDISRLLTGRNYWSHSGNHALFPVLTGLAHIMYLVVDSTHRTDPSLPIDNVNNAIRFLDERQRELRINRIPNFNEFLTPGGSYHGEYSHLGWNHVYAPETQRKWIVRQNILRDALSKQFDFSLLNFLPFVTNQNRQKLDSLAALLYYVHILGDHEGDTLTTVRTRIPIRSLDEQDRYINGRLIQVRWENNRNGIPQSTILAELNRHISILFASQRNTPHYNNLMQGINTNAFLPLAVFGNISSENPEEDFILVDGVNASALLQLQQEQQEKARWILELLFNNVPQLLRKEPFARNFMNMVR